MMELPEAVVLSRQMEQAFLGRRIAKIHREGSEHRFAFFSGDAAEYSRLLEGRAVLKIRPLGGFIELSTEDTCLLFGDGVRLTWCPAGTPLPKKHQMLVEFTGGDTLVASVQMYGGMWAFVPGQYENPYYTVAQEKPSPLSEDFNEAYFLHMAKNAKPTLSAKAFLATEQRIPGLGNGALQDILFLSHIHPKRPLQTLDETARKTLYRQVKDSLADMTRLGGRSTEKDLHGAPGGYPVLLHAKAAGAPCPVCGALIQKQAYLGGSIYFCPVCQPL